MAGRRTVEEILELASVGQFLITMFGDEPYGNYNRIVLSHVLSGQASDQNIFLNTLQWFEDNHITLHVGCNCFMPSAYGLRMPDGSLSPGVFAFRTIDDTRGMVETPSTFTTPERS